MLYSQAPSAAVTRESHFSFHTPGFDAMRLAVFVRGLAAVVALGTLVGCGQSGPELAEVGGTVTLDGKPVPNANVTFRPQGPEGSPSYGVTDANGNYELRFSRDKTGATPGTHHVEITTEKLSPEDREALKAEGHDVFEFVPVPAKYSRPGELVRDVERGGNTIDFKLESGG